MGLPLGVACRPAGGGGAQSAGIAGVAPMWGTGSPPPPRTCGCSKVLRTCGAPQNTSARPQVASSFGRHGSFGAQIMTILRQACLDAFEMQPRRLVEPIYKAHIIVRGDHSGKVYAALQRKRAEVCVCFGGGGCGGGCWG